MNGPAAPDPGRGLDTLALGSGPVVIFDLEMTAWEGSVVRDWCLDGEHPEIVQIGAVRLRPTPELEEIDTLDLLVRPRINPVLSDYLVALTGLNDAMVAEQGLTFAAALARFQGFCGASGDILSFGRDRDFLLRNCALDGLLCRIDGTRFRNVKPYVQHVLDPEGHGLTSGGLPRALGLPAPGPAHNALADVRAVAGALRHLSAAGKLRLSFR